VALLEKIYHNYRAHTTFPTIDNCDLLQILLIKTRFIQ